MSSPQNVKSRILCVLVVFSSISLKSQITRNCLSLKSNFGISFSRTTFENTAVMQNHNLHSFYPGIAYNIILSRKSFLECSSYFYSYGNLLRWGPNQLGITGKITNRFYNYTTSIIFHKKIPFSNKFFISLGPSVAASSVGSSIHYDTLMNTSLTYKRGLKFFLSVGLKYQFQIKRRTLGIDLTYTQGFTPYYDIVVTEKSNQSQNRYVNMGSGLHFGLTFYFRKHHLKE